MHMPASPVVAAAGQDMKLRELQLAVLHPLQWHFLSPPHAAARRVFWPGALHYLSCTISVLSTLAAPTAEVARRMHTSPASATTMPSSLCTSDMLDPSLAFLPFEPPWPRTPPLALGGHRRLCGTPHHPHKATGAVPPACQAVFFYPETSGERVAARQQLLPSRTCQRCGNPSDPQPRPQVCDALASDQLRALLQPLCQGNGRWPGAAPVGVPLLPSCTLHRVLVKRRPHGNPLLLWGLLASWMVLLLAPA